MISVSIVELSFTSGSGMLVSIVGTMVEGVVVGTVLGAVVGSVALLVGVVAIGSLLVQPHAAQAMHTIAAAKIAIYRFIITS